MHGRISNPNSRISTRARQFGAGALEFLVASLALFPLMLGGLQMGFVYNAKSTLNQATFEAVRIGAVKHAQSGPMQEELGRRLVSFYGSSSQGNDLEQAYIKAMVDIRQPAIPGPNSGSGTEVKILNPTPEAFTDFGEDIGGQRQIPNNHLRLRGTDIGATSGVHIQDANLLKVEVTYGYRLWVPLVNKLIAAVLIQADPANANYYQADPPRLPIKSVAMVRMQSAAYPDGAMIGTNVGGSGAIGTGSDQTGNDADNPDGQDMGGNAGDPYGSTGTADNVVTPPVDLSPIFSTTDQDCNFTMSCQTDLNEFIACRNDASQCTDTTQGGTSCAVPAQSGGQTATNSPVSTASTLISNPINVVTGNKYQQEIDIAPLNGDLGLSFTRFYNSAGLVRGTAGQTDTIGYGWHHSYQLRAQLHDNGGISVVQADGRRVVFDPTKQTDKFRALVASDGWLQTTDDPVDKFIWHRTDGTSLHFNDHGLLLLVLNPHGQALRFTYTADDQLRQVTDPQGRQLTFEYYRNQRIKKVYDPAGKFLHYRYDQRGNLTSVTNQEGHVKTYHYEDDRFPHHLTGITDERGIRFGTYAYDEKGRTNLSEHADGVEKVSLSYGDGSTTVVNSEGVESVYITEIRDGIPLVSEVRGPGCSSCGISDVQYTYNDQFQLTEERYKDGRIVRRTFDELGRLTALVTTTTEQDAQGIALEKAEFLYDSASHKPSQVVRPSVNPHGMHVMALTYTPTGQPQQFTESGWEPNGTSFAAITRTTTLNYDAQGHLQTIDGPRDDVDDTTRLTYDGAGRLRELVGPTGQTQRILAYDLYGRPTEMESLGQLTQVAYNERGLITRISRNQQVTYYEYNPIGKLVKVIQPDGQIKTFGYDDAARRVSANGTTGDQLQWQFDTEDKLVEQRFSSADGGILKTLSYLYDVEGRLQQLKNEDSSLDVSYEDDNRLVTLTNGRGGEISTTYNPLGQLVQFTQPGSSIGYEYDVKQQLSAITDARGNRTSYLRDDFGRLITRISPESGTQHYHYDNADNLTRLITATGEESLYTYDASNRLVGVIRPEGEYRLDYTDQSRLARINGPHETTEYGYTPEGLLASHSRIIDQHTFTTRYEYSENGQLIRKHLANGQTLHYEYHQSGPQAGQLRSLVQEGFFGDTPVLTELNASPSSVEKQQTFGNGIVQTDLRNAQGQLTHIDSTGTLKLKYSYNQAGQINGIEWQNPYEAHQDVFDYQHLGRLSNAATKSGEHYYHYDKAGNRVMAESDNKTQVALYANNSNRLKGLAEDVVGDLVQQNAAGSPTKIGKRRYEYNSQQRPVKLFINDQLTAEYAYNSWGERIRKVVYSGDGKTVTYYLYDGQRLVAEANGDGKIVQQYLYYKKHPVAVLKDGEVYAVHTDHLGTPRSVTNGDQQTVWTANYDPFGLAYTQEDPDKDGETFTLNLRFPGQYADAESGTYYNYHRDYDPSTGRYLTSDPIGQDGGLNTYLYANGNPVAFADPLGLAPGDAVSGVLLDPLSGLSQPTATAGLNSGTGVEGTSPAAFVAEVEDLITEYAIYTYVERTCPGPGVTSTSLADFERGVNAFTTNMGQEHKVSTLFGETLSVITHNDLLIQAFEAQNNPLTEVQFKIRRRLDVPFTLRSDPGCAILWTLFHSCPDQDRESTEAALLGDDFSVIRALTDGIRAIDGNYANTNSLNVLPGIDPENTGTMLVISSDATEDDIRKEIESLLGTELVDQREVDALIAIINEKRKAGDAAKAALVNIQPLYDKVLERFYEQMLEGAREEYEKLESEKNKTDEDYADLVPLCLSGGNPVAGDSCRSIVRLQNLTKAEEDFKTKLEESRVEFIEKGYLLRHEFDLEQDGKDSDFAIGIAEITAAVLTDGGSRVVLGIKAAVEKAARTLAVKIDSKAAKDAFIRALERFFTKGFGEIPGILTTSSGIPIKPTPGKTTTILGNYVMDMQGIIEQQLKYPKTTNFDPKPGGFNVLNVPNEMYKSPDQFWNEINKPFLDMAINRGDEIALATKPRADLLLRDDGSLTGFGREIEYLIDKGYQYDSVTGRMIRN